MSDVRLQSHEQSRTETPVTPAEKLFGFVEMRQTPDPHKKLAVLSGRVQFTDAVYTGRVAGQAVPDPRVPNERTLKTLSSPKPPCPSMYFFKDNGTNASTHYIAKTESGGNAVHKPKGRKFYLHQSSGDQCWTKASPTSDDNQDQKMRVRPIRPGAEFTFRVHFENLTATDLAQLLQSIRPTLATRFKLGLGKPLGLGTVRLDIAPQIAVFDLASRYTEASFAEPTRLQIQFLQTSDARDKARLVVPAPYRELHEVRYSGVAYPRVNHPVGDPADDEHELYEWFVANDVGSANRGGDSARRIALEPIHNGIRPLPILRFAPS